MLHTLEAGVALLQFVASKVWGAQFMLAPSCKTLT